jgi:GAF domain-containing protein
MARTQCFAGRTADGPFVASAAPGGADWLGSGDDGAEVLLCPIMLEGHLLGVLAIAEPLCTATFDDHDLELASYVAAQLSTFMQGLRQRPSIPAPYR